MIGIVRPAAWAIWLAAVIVGTLADHTPPVASGPDSHGDYIVVADFHVHSFPGDGALLPSALAHEARRRGLDVIALTNHNHQLSVRLAEVLAERRQEALLIPGDEVTAPRYHIAAVGVSRSIRWHQPAADAVAEVHADGGVAIAAHPSQVFWSAYDAAALAVLDGVETSLPMDDPKHMNDSKEKYRQETTTFYERARAAKPGIAAIGSSDFHYVLPLGLNRTYVFARELSTSSILEAVRAGRTVACDDRGNAIGPPELKKRVEARCLRDAAADPTSAADRISVICAFGSLFALVITGPVHTRRGR
jgi:hypothetical protein